MRLTKDEWKDKHDEEMRRKTGATLAERKAWAEETNRLLADMRLADKFGNSAEAGRLGDELQSLYRNGPAWYAKRVRENR
jgi:hypothetical protein